jgi:hypothetical protein
MHSLVAHGCHAVAQLPRDGLALVVFRLDTYLLRRLRRKCITYAFERDNADFDLLFCNSLTKFRPQVSSLTLLPN